MIKKNINIKIVIQIILFKLIHLYEYGNSNTELKIFIQTVIIYNVISFILIF